MYMKKQKLKVEVEVWDIHVIEEEPGDNRGYYSFKYRIRKNGGKWKEATYDNDWSSQTRAHFRRVLARGEAARIALSSEYW